MDITSLAKPEGTCEIELTHPVDEKGLGIFVTIQSETSDDVKAVTRGHTNKSMQRMQKGKMISSEIAEQQQVDKYAACIVSWRWDNEELDLNGDCSPECNTKNKKSLLDADPFFDQIREAASTFANFMQTPKKL